MALPFYCTPTAHLPTAVKARHFYRSIQVTCCNQAAAIVEEALAPRTLPNAPVNFVITYYLPTYLPRQAYKLTIDTVCKALNFARSSIL